MGVQISGVAGGKVAKNGIAVWRWVALSGSQKICHERIFNFFAEYVSGDTRQRRAYIPETRYCEIKEIGRILKDAKKSKIGHFRTAVSPRSYEFSKTFPSLRIRHLSPILETLRVGALPPSENFLRFFEFDPPFRKKCDGEISKFAHTIFLKLTRLVEGVVLSGKIAKKTGGQTGRF